ncbi:MAG: hypothetical protein JWO50_89, partial [Candidatus Kaiserbacteria bacterium]|nr:hypothetical protein [Candidatus Kaiserbacteria bacterium]
MQLLLHSMKISFIKRGIFIAVLLSPSLTFAVSYTPGQTLDPACLPTDSTCQVINTNVVAANFTA